MKKSVLYMLAAVSLALFSCSSEDDNFVIFEEHFGEWGVTVPYADVSKSETYGLLENLIEYLDETKLSHVSYPSSDFHYPSVTKFNEFLRNSKEAVSFFKRKDCVTVLVSTYLNSLNTDIYVNEDGELLGILELCWFCYFDFILASEMCMSHMNTEEKVQLMVLVMERIKYERIKYGFSSRHSIDILIAIMLSSNYTPFIDNVIVRETNGRAHYFIANGYDTLHQATDRDPETGRSQQIEENNFNLLIEYAKQFINENKEKYHEID